MYLRNIQIHIGYKEKQTKKPAAAALTCRTNIKQTQSGSLPWKGTPFLPQQLGVGELTLAPRTRIPTGASSWYCMLQSYTPTWLQELAYKFARSQQPEHKARRILSDAESYGPTSCWCQDPRSWHQNLPGLCPWPSSASCHRFYLHTHPQVPPGASMQPLTQREQEYIELIRQTVVIIYRPQPVCTAWPPFTDNRLFIPSALLHLSPMHTPHEFPDLCSFYIFPGWVPQFTS